MTVYSLGFLVVAVVAMLLGWHGWASAAAIVAIAFLVLTFLAGSAIALWYQKQLHRRSAPPV
jgi:uncharacterized membrane protein YtjA (UPF0391 family)